jgi:photosystem II stability/assembly factor-like uncharacterized protein
MKKYLLSLLLLAVVSIQLSAQKWVASPGSANLLPNNYNVYGIKVVDKDVIWATASLAVTSYNAPISANHVIKTLLTTNGGQTWRLFNVTNALGRISSDIQAFDSTTAWITVFSNNNLSGGLFKTTDGGQTWTQKFADLSGNLFLRFFDKNNGVCIGTRTRRFAYTSDAGDTWTVDTLVYSASERISSFYSGTNSCIRKGDTLWFGTTAGRIFRSTNKGRNWTPFATGIPPNWAIGSIAFSDARNGMLAGVDTVNYKFSGLLKTNDGGQSWQTVQMTLVSASFSNTPVLTAIPTKTGRTYLLGTENQISTIAISFLTRDDGNSWNVIDKDISSHGASEFITPQIGWIGNGYVSAANPASLFKWDDLGIFSPTTEQYDNTFFSVSPNPVKDLLTLQFRDMSNLETFDAHVTDVAGKVVYKMNGSYKQLNINYLPEGIYFLTVKTKNKIGVIKFVKN